MAQFVTKDGAGAEVRVETGTGQITEIREKGPNANILIRASHAKMEHPVGGWVAKDDPVYSAAVEAHAQGREIEYRIEQQRKPDIDPTIPIETLRADANGKPDMGVANKNTRKIVAMLDKVMSNEAVTNPERDPARGGRVRDTGDAPAQAAPAAGPAVPNKEAALAALATARAAGMSEFTIGACEANALVAGATAKEVREAGHTDQAQRLAARPEARRTRAAEAPPHVAFNSDGRINLGSYAVQAMDRAEQVAHNLLAEINQQAFDDYNAAVEAGEVDGEKMDAPEPVPAGQALGIAEVLMEIADHVQVGAYGGGRPDRMANSHTRARARVFNAVRTQHPLPLREALPEDATAEEQASAAQEHQQRLTAWRTAIIEEEVERFQAVAASSQKVAQIESAASEQEDAAQQGQARPAQGQPRPVAAVGQQTAQQTAQQARPKPPIEGQEGFVAPADDVKQRFGALAAAAGFEAKAGSPVQVYLGHKFGVNIVRKIHGPALNALVTWFERQEEPAKAFREHVEREAGTGASQNAEGMAPDSANTGEETGRPESQTA